MVFLGTKASSFSDLILIAQTAGFDNDNLSDKTKMLGSILAVAGAILVTLAFYFLQVIPLRALAFPFRQLKKKIQ